MASKFHVDFSTNMESIAIPNFQKNEFKVLNLRTSERASLFQGFKKATPYEPTKELILSRPSDLSVSTHGCKSLTIPATA